MNSGKIPIIAFEHTAWHSSWAGRQHILSRLGERGWPVLYSNGASYYNEISFSKPFGTVEETDNVTLYHAGFLLPRNYRIKFLDRLAIKQHCRVLKKRAGLTTGDKFIAFCFHPDFYPYVEELNAPYVMFHIFDIYHLIGAPEGESSNVQKLIDQSDLVTAASEMMWNEMVSDKTLKPKMIYNGVDTSAFEKKHPRKGHAFQVIERLPSPKVGYLGAINCKLDFTILDHLAERFPEAKFIMIGARKDIGMIQRDDQNWAAFQRYFERQNVHYLETIKREEIPACLNLMDVTIAPYKTDKSTWAFAGYPLKLNEYLAAGKPVLSAATPTVIQHFSEIVATCETRDEWENALCDALDGRGVGTPESRICYAKKQDWQIRVDKLEQLMSTMLTGEAGPENN